MQHHDGRDYSFAEGTEVKACADGTILRLWESDSYGNVVEILHYVPERFCSLYAHLKCWVTNLEVGDVVHAGQIIALTGNTGKSSGPHLHFELTTGGKPQYATGESLEEKRVRKAAGEPGHTVNPKAGYWFNPFKGPKPDGYQEPYEAGGERGGE